MPCLEISMPEISTDLKAALAKELTDTFVNSTGYDREIFGIKFNEYSENQAASGGKLGENEVGRPYLHFILYIPRISRDFKKTLVESISSTFTRIMGKPEWKPVIHIAEHPYDNVGVNGTILSELFPELANKKFYYGLGEE